MVHVGCRRGSVCRWMCKCVYVNAHVLQLFVPTLVHYRGDGVWDAAVGRTGRVVSTGHAPLHRWERSCNLAPPSSLSPPSSWGSELKRTSPTYDEAQDRTVARGCAWVACGKRVVCVLLYVRGMEIQGGWVWVFCLGCVCWVCACCCLPPALSLRGRSACLFLCYTAAHHCCAHCGAAVWQANNSTPPAEGQGRGEAAAGTPTTHNSGTHIHAATYALRLFEGLGVGQTIQS